MPTNNRIEDQFEALSAEIVASSELPDEGIGLTLGNVSEKVGNVSGNKPVTAGNVFTDDEKKGLFALIDFGAVSGRIASLIRTSGVKTKKIPSPEKQVKLVRKSLEKEQRNLIKQARKIQNGSRFSAAKLEQVLLQIRQVQKILKELVTAAKDRIAFLYQKYVLKNA
jgi:hypothetical protein